jgi:hypothetical protein
MDNLLYEELPNGEQITSRYFLLGEGGQEGRSEITKWQYEQLKSRLSTAGTYSEEDLVRLHQEQSNAQSQRPADRKSDLDQSGIQSEGTDGRGTSGTAVAPANTGRAAGDVFGEANSPADVADINAAASKLAEDDAPARSGESDPTEKADAETEQTDPEVTDTLADEPAQDAAKVDEAVQSEDIKTGGDDVGSQKPRGKK